ncbi:MAG TPA: VIT domain-containing protein [Kofleriaceae bacterium]|jgi:tetratricopeptide (TPR) repeat protein
MSDDKDILEKNVESLLESGGEAPKMNDMARARLRAKLVTAHATATPKKKSSPLLAIGGGLAAAAAAALIITRVVGHGGVDVPTPVNSESPAVVMADGTTWITTDGAKVTVLGDRHVRVEGAALLDVAPKAGVAFTVETARGTINVLGTRFLVDAQKERTTAAVVRGIVELATSDGKVTLHAGEQAVAEPGRPPTRGPAPRLSHLVSWAEQARRAMEHDIAPLHNGTLYARDPRFVTNGQSAEEKPLPIAKIGVDVVVEDQVARVALDQTFFNPNDQVMEGMYRFAIPPDASLQRLAMYVDGKLTESAVVERMRARRIYEELVYRRVDPALLEWNGTGRLALRVYPLPPKQDKRLMVAYTQSLPKLYDDWTLSVPLPELDQPVGEVAFDVTLRGCGNCEVTSPSHAITVDRKGSDAIVSYHKTGGKLGDSLVLRVRDTRTATTTAKATDGADHFLMVRAPSVLPNVARTYKPHQWVILDDVSASRGAMERRAQADMIDAFARELDEDDTMSVVAFDVSARTKLKPTRVRDVNRQDLRRALNAEGDVGATDFQAALTAAQGLLGNTAQDDATIVYLGDGVITAGPRQLDTLRAQLANKARFVGVGIGDGPDTQTLDALAAATGGYATTIDLADDVAWRTFDLVAALHTERATGVTAKIVDANGNELRATTYTAAQIADGEQIEIVAKVEGPMVALSLPANSAPAAVELTGTVDGAPWSQHIALGESHEAGYLPRLWAARHIAARMLAKHEAVTAPPCTDKKTPCQTDAQTREARDEVIRHEVIDLGKKYFLLSRHTSLIVLENDAMYAQYGVQKGAGTTWAPYAMPATIPVAKVAAPTNIAPSDVASDAELFRTPLQLFASNSWNGGYKDGWGGDDLSDSLLGNAAGEMSGGFGFGRIGVGAGGGGSFGTLGHGSGTGSGYGVGGGRGGMASRSRGDVDLAGPISISDKSTDSAAPSASGKEAPVEEVTAAVEAKAELQKGSQPDEDRPVEKSERMTAQAGAIDQQELRRHISTAGLLGAMNGDLANKGGGGYYGGYYGGLQPMRLSYPGDAAFSDLSMWVPALFPDASDAWRTRFEGDNGKHTIDAGATKLLAAARAALPSGVYRWDDREIAVDAQHRFGWKRTTEDGLAETASFDGSSFARRYAELGLDVTRAVSTDDVALSLAYLPILIAEPAHYAAWFDVKLTSASEVTLSRTVAGKSSVEMTMVFDAQNHLVALRDGDGHEAAAITWTTSGPTALRVGERATPVGFQANAIADAMAWAHTASAQETVVQLPLHLAAFGEAAGNREAVGSAPWRTAKRQLLATYAATSDTLHLFETFELLLSNGGVTLGDVVLASAGLATTGTDKQIADGLASVANTSVARYLIAGRMYNKSPASAKLKPETTGGVVGAVWQLREIASYFSQGGGAKLIDKVLAMPASSPHLRLLAVALLSSQWNQKPDDIAKAWDSVATGDMVNVARANAAIALVNRGASEQAAEMVGKLVDGLDLTAEAPPMGTYYYAVQQSRRGVAGWQMLWASWRDKVIAGNSFSHVIGLARMGQGTPGDLNMLLARALVLAGDDQDRQLAVAYLASSVDQAAIAQDIVDKALAKKPSRELHQLDAQILLRQQRLGDALDHLEAAQTAGADEQVDINTVRAEIGQIIGLAARIAQQQSGAQRDKYVARAMEWGARWRALDPGNATIDKLLGELQLSVGNKDEAWRQLSTVIERDPMQGTGYMTVAETFEGQGRAAEALDFWEQAIRLDQTNPTPRLRKARALIALGRTKEGDAIVDEILSRKWHDMWWSVIYEAQQMKHPGSYGRWR